MDEVVAEHQQRIAESERAVTTIKQASQLVGDIVESNLTVTEMNALISPLVEAMGSDRDDIMGIIDDVRDKFSESTSNTPVTHIFLDSFVQTKMGEPFRLLPFGRLYRGDHEFDFTPEMAAAMKLPHYKPPIKIGGHADDAPAGGHLVGLEIHGDGLYGIPEWTEKGLRRMDEGDYRYQSPEILWEGRIQDATTGKWTEGPAIVGIALLHNPALGEAAAFYSTNVEAGEDDEPPAIAHENGGKTMSDRTIEVPREMGEGMIARFNAWLDQALGGSDPDPAPQEPPPQPQRGEGDQAVASDELAALTEKAQRADELEAELEEYRAQMEQATAEKERAARVSHFAAELEETAVAEDDGLHEALADLEDEQAAPIVQRLKSLSAQVETLSAGGGLEDDLGAGEDPTPETDNPVAAFNEAVMDKMAAAEEKGTKLSYIDAFQMVRNERPDLARAASGGR